MNILRGKYFSFISRVKRAVLRVSTFQDEGVCLLNKHIQLRYVRRFLVSTFRPFSVAKLFFASLNFQTLLQFLVKLFDANFLTSDFSDFSKVASAIDCLQFENGSNFDVESHDDDKEHFFKVDKKIIKL